MATATEVRAANGSSSKRGKLSAAAIADWNTNHPDDPYEPGAPRDGFTGNADDYPEDGFDSYFPEVDGDGDGLGDTSETPPKRPRANPKAGVKRGLFSRKPKTGAKKKGIKILTGRSFATPPYKDACYGPLSDDSQKHAAEAHRMHNLELLDRKPKCTCGKMVGARFNYCPNCKCNLHPSCPQCKQEVAEDDKYCPNCAFELRAAPPSEPANPAYPSLES